MTGIFGNIRHAIRGVGWLRNFLASTVIRTGLLDPIVTRYRVSHEWEKRIQTVIAASDNQRIYRCPSAGRVMAGKQLMHNGLWVALGSYYGPEMVQLLIRNRGVHEPQEEWAFSVVLPHLKPSSCMVELGSFWGFYSLWFKQFYPAGRTILVEPDAFNLKSGLRNFRLNGLACESLHAWVGQRPSGESKKVPLIGAVEITDEKKIDRIDLLHADIQGAELAMLEGARPLFYSGRVGYTFISTHSDDLHQKCLSVLQEYKQEIVCEVDLNQSYSADGLIVAKAPTYPGPRRIDICRRQSTLLSVELQKN